MSKIKSFTFNPFQENTYIIEANNKQCAIIDPGCSTPVENSLLENYITNNNLKPVVLLNTHCHIDHILGNKFIADTYNLDVTRVAEAISPKTKAVIPVHFAGLAVDMDALLTLAADHHAQLGSNLRMTGWQAAILLAQMEKVSTF